MNLTVLSLISIGQALHSPLITFNIGTRIGINSCLFSKHFQTILFERNQSPGNDMYVLNSKFAQILNSPIYIRHDSDFSISKSPLKFIDNLKHTIEATIFTECKGFKGGCIYSKSPNLQISHCIFNNNTANYGTAVYATNIVNGKCGYSLFSSNYANNLCAGYFLDSNPQSKHTLLIEYTNFTHQTATCVGAIECWDGFPQIKWCEIDHCRSTLSLPAVRTSTVRTKDLSYSSLIDTVTFRNCSSRQHGAVFQSFLYNSAALLRNCIMIDNSCLWSSPGTLIYIENLKVTVILENCVIYGKEERQFGGVKNYETIITKNVTFKYDPEKDYMKDTPIPTQTPYIKDKKHISIKDIRWKD